LDLSALAEGLRSLWVVWLLLLFVGIVWWVYRPKNRQKFEDAARIPFREENGGP
jgi:cytochrome c oxidase cbb3-type subunit 4